MHAIHAQEFFNGNFPVLRVSVINSSGQDTITDDC